MCRRNAASTGGPRALAELLPAIPRGLGIAVCVVQHLPQGFTRGMVERLDKLCALRVTEASDGLPLLADNIYLAPGGLHLKITGTVQGLRLELSEEPPIHGVRPAADPLFEAAARIFGPRTLAVVMTGMGKDGCQGVRTVKANGGYCLAQTPETAVAIGMPTAAIATGLVDSVLPLTELAGEIADVARRVIAQYRILA